MKKMVRKKGRAKRFDEGGPTEDQLKAEGLKASQGEDVGFFRRLAMGNIDDPSSEAYAQFGAGRGRAERARQAPQPAPQPAPQAPQPAMNPVAANAPVPQASQWNTPWGASSFPVPQNAPRMVEQEEEGPVRPKKRVRQEAPQKVSTSTDRGVKDVSKRFPSAADRMIAEEEKAAKKTPAKTAPVERSERSKDEEAYALARKPSAKALESWKMFGFKSGGSVGSGYRTRADGITSRGKTKGRFV